jgi:hypothetical protein
LLLSGAFGAAPSAARSSATKQILLLFLVVTFVSLGYNRRVGVYFFIIISVFGAIPKAVAVIFVDRPAPVLVLVVFVGTLAATEATDIVRFVVIRKTQWLH